ncbi:DEAD-like helicase [Saudi moumouvirus]|uniref:Helicase ATP-binding domain-containing protein n=1 Tax=Moumouvirus sp. 'Monve' TaxID=1128131 RepID=H2EDQ3_9VIRU|nr:hypothetical protein mv_R321 [Moumouvirus Monve]AQN68526.1 DEAD-like helicase [Saudi moumouvirus]
MSKISYKFLYKIPHNINDEDYYHNNNIVECSANILKKFRKYREVITIAEMQSGKTDVMKRLVFIINNYNKDLKNIGIDIDKYNIYVIICASSLNLKTQHQLKLSEIKHKIYHLNDINNMIKNQSEYESVLITMADSSLIIFDECHCDAECEKLIDKFRKLIKRISKENNTKYYKVGFSATAYEQILAGYPKVIMWPGTGYYGIRDMFKFIENNKSTSLPVIFPAKNLSISKECEELFEEIGIYKKYYIFRLPGKRNLDDVIIEGIANQFKIRGSKIDTYIYDMSYKDSINSLINEKPNKPTVIFIKDKLRLGEYLNTKYVYLVHDDPNNMYTHTTVQSLLGRCCGYNKKEHGTLIYCDHNKAYEHYLWIINNYDIKYIPSHAKYITKNNKIRQICIY